MKKLKLTIVIAALLIVGTMACTDRAVVPESANTRTEPIKKMIVEPKNEDESIDPFGVRHLEELPN